MQGQVQCEPQHFCITQKTDAEEKPDYHHRGEDEGVGVDAQQVSHQRPDAESHGNGGAVTYRDLRQKVSALPHEVVAAKCAPFGCVEVSMKYPRVLANRTTQMNDG